MKKYMCIDCGYLYDPQKGDGARGINAGVSFESLPQGWSCPVCGVSKGEFTVW
jgi:rubredoxin